MLRKASLVPSTQRVAGKERSASEQNPRALHAKAPAPAASPVTTAGDVSFILREPLKTPQRAQTSRGLSELDVTSTCLSKWDDRRWRYVIMQDQIRTRSCPLPPRLTQGHHDRRFGGSVRKPCLHAHGRRTHCSVKSSLLVSGWPQPRQGCCHWWAAWGHWWWLACRLSLLARLGGYLGKAAVTGCSAGHPESPPSYPTHCLAAIKKNTNHSTRRCSPAVGILLVHSQAARITVMPALASDTSCKKPNVEEAHKAVEKGRCKLPRVRLPCIWGARCGTGTPSKPWHRDVQTATWSVPQAKRRFFLCTLWPVQTAGIIWQGKRSNSDEDGGLCRYNQYSFQPSHISSLFMTWLKAYDRKVASWLKQFPLCVFFVTFKTLTLSNSI